MTLDPEVKDSLTAESQILSNTVLSIESQLNQASIKFRSENNRAKELTQAIMHTQRDEDKALLASDEAVSHGIRDQKKDLLESLSEQVKKPYFARIELAEEDLQTGKIKNIEYKLGFSANPDCRIIDWRKAPISKLYYEYKEGDEYSEEIQGKERYGKVTLRNRIDIEDGQIVTVQNRYGSFIWDSKNLCWKAGGDVRRTKATAGQLPEILSLITAEQFKAITEEAKTAVLIQGVAGSGKTTVALHRLAWMLHEDNSDIKPEEIVFLTVSPSLKMYIENSLPALGTQAVKVRTYHEWTARTLKYISQDSNFVLSRPVDGCPSGIDRVKRSMALLKAIENYAAANKDTLTFKTTLSDIQDSILAILRNPTLILEQDETKLLDRGLIQQAYERTKRNFSESMYDLNDDALLVRLFQIAVGGRLINETGSLGKYEHIFVDEVQDMSPVELATVVASCQRAQDITLVGDTSQNLDQQQSFPGWDKLRKYWNLGSDESKFIQLTVSFRSSLPIMKLAEHIQKRDTINTGRQGRRPIWFACKDEQDGIAAAIKWLSKAVELFPNALTAVICPTPAIAKFAYKMLQNHFGAIIRLGDAFSFSFEEGILVTDVRQVKGLEFFSVLLWNPSKQSYPSGPLGDNLLYVAVTRAEENLSIVTWDKQHPSLPTFGQSKLIRSMDLRIVDEEKPEDD